MGETSITRKEKSMYVIYDTKDHEQCMGVFDKTKDVAAYFETSKESIRTSIARKHKRKGRYIIEKVEE